MEKNEIKLGVIGTNFVSDWLCDAVSSADGITAHAVYSRTAEKGREFAEKHGIANVYTSLGDFLASDIDAVYIASPNFLHREQAVMAMNAGKHVLVEKPAALNSEEYAEMTECAKRNRVILMEAMRPVHDPALDTAVNEMKKLGEVRHAVFDFCQYSSRYDRFKRGEVMNAFDPSLGNAAIMDIGVYAIETCIAVFGKPRSLFSRSMFFENGFEGMGNALLDYGSFCAEIVYSKISDSVNTDYPSYIMCEGGSVSLGKLSMMTGVKSYARGSEEKVLVGERFENGGSNMIFEVNDFVSAIGGERLSRDYGALTRDTICVMDEIRRQSGVVFPERKQS